MTTSAPPWTISSSAERVELDATGKAQTTFTVTNHGPVDQRLVMDVVRSENAGRINVVVTEPQRLVPHGGSVTFLVTITAPPGTPPDQCWVAGRAYSADTAPEESSVLSDRVAFQIRPSEAPPPWWKKWWWVFAVAALVVIVLVVVLVVALGGDEPAPGPAVHASGEVVVPEGPFDFDELTRLDVRGDPASDVELFGAAIEAERFFQSDNARGMTRLGPSNDPRQACLDAELTPRFGVNLGEVNVGDVFCIETDQGRLSVAEVRNKVSANASSLTLAVTTFE